MRRVGSERFARVVGIAPTRVVPAPVDLLERPSTHEPAPIARAFDIGVLGSLSVQAEDESVPIRRGLPRILLSCLVLDRGRPVSAAALIDRLWADQLPNNPSNALQTQIAYLRRALGGADVAPIATVPSGYVLDGVDVDVDRFEAALARGRESTDRSSEPTLSDALAAYDEALSLWRGSPYSDVAGHEFAVAEIVRLEELWLSTLEERCDVLLALGRASEAVAELSSMVNAQPLRERGQQLLVLALYRSGRQADALRAYDRARRTLVDELGVEPGAQLQVLEQQVLDHDPALDWVPTVGDRPQPVEADPAAIPEYPETDGGSTGAPLPVPPIAARRELIGRDHELQRVSALIDDRRLVTLTGPGGAGKTRLASAVASATDDAVHHVDFAAIEEHQRVGNLIAWTMGLQVTADNDPVTSVITEIESGSTLLVLDTCEHVLDGVGPVVERLLDSCAGLRVLATSRRPLGLADELAWPIPPLGVPTAGSDPATTAAFELFVQRAVEVNPAFEVGAAQVDEIAELCRALDGLPLAIELAAAQMDVLSPKAVRMQLAERRSFGRRTGGPDRHRTLDATTAWSVDLLRATERDMLYRLAVFAPTFDLEAAVAVAGGGGGDAVERFVTLVRNSLVVHGPDDRYRLLDTVRAYLTASETDGKRHTEAQQHHGEYYATLAARSFRKVRGATQSQWLHRLDEDRSNILLALRWCFGPDGDEQLGARLAGDIAWVWALQGNTLDSRAVLERGRDVDAEPLVRARLLLGIGLLAAPLADHAHVLEVCGESAELGRSVGDDETVAVALLTLGVAQWATGDLVAAAASHDEAIELFGAVGDRWSRTVGRVLRARTARDADDLDLAEQLLDASIDDAKHTGDDHVIGLAYEQIARLALARGQLDRASSAATASLHHNEVLGYTEGISAALTLVAEVEIAGGDGARARQLVVRALALAVNIGHVGAMCAAVESAAAVEVADGLPACATRLLLIAQRARRRFGLPLAPRADARFELELARLRDELGSAWDDIAAQAPMTSLEELARSIVESSAGPGGASTSN